MSHLSNKPTKPEHAGLRLRAPARYDLLVWLLTLGRPRQFRERMLRPARLQRGERVLDVSCGTGSLALLAKKQVGTEGRVHGVDASEEMIAFAAKKAKRAGVDVSFDVASAQELPFEDGSFDVVLNTLALHHLPRTGRYEAFGEIRRVLRPDGRALIVDFAEGKKRSGGLLRRFKHRHGSVPMEEIVTAMRERGFEIAATGAVGAKSLHFVLAGPREASMRESASAALEEAPGRTRSNSHLVPVAGALLVAGLLVIHAAGGAAIIHGATTFGDPSWLMIGAIGLAAIAAKVLWFRRFHRRR